MIEAFLTRGPSTVMGTFGSFKVPAIKFESLTLELPWLDNKPMRSCIPTGRYRCAWIESPSRGRCTYRILVVRNRSGILIHSASYGGDIDAGFKSDLEGCIALGLGTKNVTLDNGNSQTILTDSWITVHKFEHLMEQREFDLIVQERLP